MSETAGRDVIVDLRGQVPPDAAQYARSRIAAAAGRAHEPVLHARAKLTEAADPAVARPAIAQANLDLNGRGSRQPRPRRRWAGDPRLR
jgi:hypothetical protein